MTSKKEGELFTKRNGGAILERVSAGLGIRQDGGHLRAGPGREPQGG